MCNSICPTVITWPCIIMSQPGLACLCECVTVHVHVCVREKVKRLFLPARMSVMTPERPETPRSAALTAEKQENGWTREAGDRDKDGEREPVETSEKRER